jgi:hypothetical protein
MTQAAQLSALGTALGTEVLGIDLSKPLDDETFAWIQGAFAEHPVLVFRNQNLGALELAAFGRRFGTPRPHALVKYRHADCPEVSWLTNVEDTGKIDWYGVKRATDWHTDSTFENTLPLLAVLHAKEVPSEKGGTMFTDMRAAYDRLPAEKKQLLSGLTALHGRSSGPAGDRLYGDDKGVTDKKYSETPWPAVTQAPGQRTGDPVRESDAHAWLRRHDARGSLAPDRGACRPRDPGALRLLPPLARRRRADVGRARHHAPRRRRLSAGRAPHHAAHDRLSELRARAPRSYAPRWSALAPCWSKVPSTSPLDFVIVPPKRQGGYSNDFQDRRRLSHCPRTRCERRLWLDAGQQRRLARSARW